MRIKLADMQKIVTYLGANGVEVVDISRGVFGEMVFGAAPFTIEVVPNPADPRTYSVISTKYETEEIK